MKSFFIISMLVVISSHASAAIFYCDSVNELGDQGRLVADPTTKSIFLIGSETTSSIFDANTFCGFAPPSPGGITCPFESQSTKDSLVLNLKCTLRTETNPILITSGNLSIRNTKGSLHCSTTHSKMKLKLANCYSK